MSHICISLSKLSGPLFYKTQASHYFGFSSQSHARFLSLPCFSALPCPAAALATCNATASAQLATSTPPISPAVRRTLSPALLPCSAQGTCCQQQFVATQPHFRHLPQPHRPPKSTSRQPQLPGPPQQPPPMQNSPKQPILKHGRGVKPSLDLVISLSFWVCFTTTTTPSVIPLTRDLRRTECR